jgi:inner membrane protein
MISSYVWVALNSLKRASIVLVMLSALYSVLYSLLQLEDFALLFGTALLVFVVMVLMFVTRNIKPIAADSKNHSVDTELPAI